MVERPKPEADAPSTDLFCDLDVLVAETLRLVHGDGSSRLRHFCEAHQARRTAPRRCVPSSPEDEASKARKLRRFYRLVHLHRKKRTAISLSGGGERSGSFGLGVLQALAVHRRLESANYLSTVSGGGYIGSWLTAWIHRDGLRAALDGLRAPLKVPRGPLANPTLPEPEPIRHLRSYTRYLSPHVGLFSADLWTLVATYVRNLLMNWLVLVPLLAALLMLPRFALWGVEWFAHASCGDRTVDQLRFTFLAIGGGLQVWALATMDRNRPSLLSSGAAGQGITQVRFLWSVLLPVVLAALLVTLPLPACIGKLGYADIVGFEVAAYALAWATHVTFLGGWRRFFDRRDRVLIWLDLAISVVAGWFCGGVLWLLAEHSPLATEPGSAMDALAYAGFAVPAYIGSMVLAGALLHGFTAAWSKYDDDLEWSARAAGWGLIAGLGWLGAAAIVFYGPTALLWGNACARSAIGGLGLGAGAAAALLGQSPKTPATRVVATAMVGSSRWRTVALNAAVTVFILLLLAGIALATDFLAGKPTPPFDVHLHASVLDGQRLWCSPTTRSLTFAFAILAVAVLATSWLVNVNTFSLQAVYRARLVRAYLGASRRRRLASPLYSPFTGFDREDDLALADIRDPRCDENPASLLHVINITLNLVNGKELAWQDRKACSFTATPLHCGSAGIGYRSSQVYGGGDEAGVRALGLRRSISLGTALAISGAAASPNMGYHSSPLVGFIMAMFNVRLGAWLGNPGPSGGAERTMPPTFGRASPRISSVPLVAELLGLTDKEHGYVYLSDGGHFENLGVYEMVRRRCHAIIVSDAGADVDGTFDDLGTAIRNIRIDLGITIEFGEQIPILARGVEPPPNVILGYCALAKIKYSEVDGHAAHDGTLIYFKPAFYGREPVDVYNYGMKNKSFPHEPTSHQFFSESQFESYRRLGYYIIDNVLNHPVSSTERAVRSAIVRYF